MRYDTRENFETDLREMVRPFIGDDADEYDEMCLLLDLSEDGWPDHEKWFEVYERLYDSVDPWGVRRGTLTPREREQAVAYYTCEDGDEVQEEMRL